MHEHVQHNLFTKVSLTIAVDEVGYQGTVKREMNCDSGECGGYCRVTGEAVPNEAPPYNPRLPGCDDCPVYHILGFNDHNNQ